MAWIPCAFKTSFTSTITITKLAISFTCVEACRAIPLLYTICKVCTHADSDCKTSLIYHIPASDNIPQCDFESQVLTLSKGVTHVPDEIVYKLTYPVKGHSQEGPLLSQFNNQFGIENVIGYHDCGPEDPHGSTRCFLNNAEFWEVFEQQDLRHLPEGRRHVPEERGLQCIALSGKGKAFIDLKNPDGGTPSPGKLLETILHAIIGKW